MAGLCKACLVMGDLAVARNTKYIVSFKHQNVTFNVDCISFFKNVPQISFSTYVTKGASV